MVNNRRTATRLVLSLFILSSIGTLAVRAQNLSAPKLSDEESATFVLLPDPQNYTKYKTNQPIFELMTRWVESQIEPLNILGVICTGDLVEQNDLVTVDGKNGDQTGRQQWQAASRAFEVLDNKVPYMIMEGNHDIGYKSAEYRDTHFPEYFRVERNDTWAKHLVEVFPDAQGRPAMTNALFEFDVPHWGKVLFITTEFTPRDEVLEWAKERAASEKYADHLVVFMTHSYLRSNGSRIEKESYKATPANYGEDIWQKLIYPSKNIRLVLCGHYCLIGDYEANVGQRTDKNSVGKSVFQMMFNAQTAGGGWQGNGGDGWLRLLEFMPDGKTIRVQTYSPLFGFSPETEHLANRTESYDRYSIVLD